MFRLPRFLRINDARRTKRVYLESLSPEEREVFETLRGGGSVFGGGKNENVVISAKVGQNPNDSKVLPWMPVIRIMEKNGWLRFHLAPCDGCGWYWMTDSAQRLSDVLREGGL